MEIFISIMKSAKILALFQQLSDTPVNIQYFGGRFSDFLKIFSGFPANVCVFLGIRNLRGF